jgi:hypothetical protein
MTSWARPGVKCVCIDAESERYTGLLRHVPGRVNPSFHLVLGRTYVVREVFRHPFADVMVVTLHGVPDRTPEHGYAIARFRPLITRTQEQDLELFRPLLTPSPIDAGLVPAGVEFSE